MRSSEGERSGVSVSPPVAHNALSMQSHALIRGREVWCLRILTSGTYILPVQSHELIRGREVLVFPPVALTLYLCRAMRSSEGERSGVSVSPPVALTLCLCIAMNSSEGERSPYPHQWHLHSTCAEPCTHQRDRGPLIPTSGTYTLPVQSHALIRRREVTVSSPVALFTLPVKSHALIRG